VIAWRIACPLSSEGRPPRSGTWRFRSALRSQARACAQRRARHAQEKRQLHLHGRRMAGVTFPMRTLRRATAQRNSTPPTENESIRDGPAIQPPSTRWFQSYARNTQRNATAWSVGVAGKTVHCAAHHSRAVGLAGQSAHSRECQSRVRVTVKAAERRSAPTALLERAIGGREYVVHCAVYNAQHGRRAAAVPRCPPRPFARPRRPRARWAATIDVLARGTHPISVGAPPPKPPHARRPRPSPLCDPPRCKSIGDQRRGGAPDTATVGC
jgi:hypothetical protein